MDQTSNNLQRLASALAADSERLVSLVGERFRREAPAYYRVQSADFQHAGYSAVCAVLTCVFEALKGCGQVPDRLPPGLVDETLLAARNDLPWPILHRSYGVTHEVLAEAAVAELASWHLRNSDQTLLLQLVTRAMFRCFDFLTYEALTLYETERREWLDERERESRAMIDHVLGGFPVSDAELGYGTHQEHVGVVGWGRDPRALIRAAARSLGAELLVVTRERATVWAWLGRPQFGGYASVVRAFPGDERSHIALGAVQAGRLGFIATHHQAALASLIAARKLRAPGASVTAYRDVALDSVLLADEDRARTFANYVLAGLATREPNNEKLMLTLRTFHESGQSTAIAAHELGIAERTVRYRLRLAEERLGQRVSLQEVALAVRVHAALRAQASGRPVEDFASPNASHRAISAETLATLPSSSSDVRLGRAPELPAHAP